jgi:serine/threonine-protein kinase
MFVPVHPRKLIPAAFLAAATDPIAAHLAALRHPGYSPHSLAFIPNFLMAAVAVLHAKFVLRLTSRIEKAREYGSYRLEKLLGRGGMGEVWRASHGMLARPAAVKLIRPEILDANEPEEARSAMKRFEREAQATAALRSPHTVELFDFGITKKGTFYYVMELLDGLDLTTLVTRYGPVPASRASHLMRQACHSLADAHARGLVHRDVKPANLFTCRLGLDHDFVKVLDFGLVKSDRGSIPDDGLRTRADVTAGTPAFMAPEMLTGEQKLDGRSDLYALGCVGYWLVSGQLVFDAETPLEMAVMHARDEPIPPSGRSEMEIPGAFESVLMDCLAKDRDQRPATATELARRLASIEYPRPWTPEDAKRWWEIHCPAPAPVEPERKGEAPTASATYLRARKVEEIER